MNVTSMSVDAHRKVRLGVGSEVMLGGSVTFAPDEKTPASDQFAEAQEKILGIVNRFADKIEEHVTAPENWPGAKK